MPTPIVPNAEVRHGLLRATTARQQRGKVRLRLRPSPASAMHACTAAVRRGPMQQDHAWPAHPFSMSTTARQVLVLLK